MHHDEIWKDIEGAEGRYQVSNMGRVKSLGRTVTCKRTCDSVPMSYFKKESILEGRADKDGYRIVVIDKIPRRVHRLVGEAFIPNPDNKPFLDHINTIPYDNRVENLRWVTLKENNNNPLTKLHQSKARIGIKPSAETRRKISEVQIGRKHTEETKRKMSQSRMGHPTYETTKEKLKLSQPKRRQVICLDTNEVFNTYNDAGRKYGFGLWLALKENRRYKGMMFKYMDVVYAT